MRPAAALAPVFALLFALVQPAAADSIATARYAGPTDRYPHGALGDPVEFDTLEVRLDSGRVLALRWPEGTVFEDTAPRVVDLDGDGRAEVVVVESEAQKGARLAVYGIDRGALTLRAATRHIGQRFRWLAVAGAGDLDGDGRAEIAYVDRPHLARVLRVVRYLPGRPRLAEVASARGHTNHRFGDRRILGGVRRCAGAPEIVTASPDWGGLLGSRLVAGRIETRRLGPNGPGAVARAMACKGP